MLILCDAPAAGAKSFSHPKYNKPPTMAATQTSVARIQAGRLANTAAVGAALAGFPVDGNSGSEPLTTEAALLLSARDVTGAMNLYPRRGIVSMNSGLSGESLKTCRNFARVTLTFP